MESIYTVPVKVPVATRDDGDDDADEAVEFRMIVDGMIAGIGDDSDRDVWEAGS